MIAQILTKKVKLRNTSDFFRISVPIVSQDLHTTSRVRSTTTTVDRVSYFKCSDELWEVEFGPFVQDDFFDVCQSRQILL